MDNEQLKKTIGANLNYVKENFRMASTNSNVELIARVPLIPDHTTSVENLNQIMDFLYECRIETTPFAAISSIR